MLDLVRDLHRQNVELAGMVGSLQQRLVYADERIRALEAPKPDSLEIAPQRDSEHAADESTKNASRGARTQALVALLVVTLALNRSFTPAYRIGQ